MHKKATKYTAVILATLIIGSSSVLPSATVFAENENENIGVSSHELTDYSEYSKTNLEKADESVKIALESFACENAEANYTDGKLVWNGNGCVSFNTQIKEGALYNIEILWRPLKNGTDVTLGVKIDGEYPFDGSNTIVLPREWENVTEKPRTDFQGNQYAQEQKETGLFITQVLRDNTGAVVDPYEIALTGGAHTLTLVDAGQPMEISAITFSAPEKPLTYKELSATYDVKELKADTVTVQGEAAARKTSNSLIPKSNNSDAGMTPSDAFTAKINYIGGSAWSSPGEKLTWDFEIAKTGYYYINLRYKQSDLVNGESWRWLKIDGKTPFKEAKELRFPYDSAWKNKALSDSDGNPFYIFLEKGKHTISLESTIGNQAEYFSRFSKIINLLGDEYIKIIMITGESPDVNRDYELFKQIPNFTETLTECRDGLDSLASDMKSALGKRSTQCIAAMENMSRVLKAMIRSPYVAQQYVSDYYTNYTSLSSWLFDMTSMPLSLDEIQFVPAGQKAENKKVNFFKKFAFGFVRLCVSFSKDYQTVDNNSKDGENTIRLWVNWGQDQAAVLNSLIEDSFTSKTGIHVRLEVVSASLINGILSGNFPDLSLHMSRTEPVNLGMRGALADLTQFDDYKEVLKRFQPDADIPYRYGDALYALPDTQSFLLMFYRTDIFEKLNLKVPADWDEFLQTTVNIQRNNMNVYIPYTQIVSATTVNAGIGSLHLLPTLLSQNGLSLYNDKQNATTISSDKSIEVVKQWTELYTKYGILKEADFYNRMRVGVMPLGIAPYSTYMTFCSAAPEIKGRWAIAPVPASSNGNAAIAGAGTGCAIIQKSSKKQQAWEFLKWWTSAETQARYTNNVESLLGMIGRTCTANMEAFENLAWDASDLEILKEQWSRVVEVPEVPGSYYLTRAVDQAYWSIVNGDTNVKDALVKWGDVANDEIARKIKEYS